MEISARSITADDTALIDSSSEMQKGMETAGEIDSLDRQPQHNSGERVVLPVPSVP